MEATASYIEDQMRSFGFEVQSERYEAGGVPVRNLVAQCSAHASSTVILGAHYDTVPTTPGADDNASAVAVLLETMRSLASTKTRHAMRFVAFACEEPPYFWTQEMGSQVHARGCRERGDRIAGMVCLEMLGYFAPEQDQLYPDAVPRLARTLLPSKSNFLVSVGSLQSLALIWRFRCGFKKATQLKLLSVGLPQVIPEIGLSDHRSFWQEGFPALMLTDTSYFRNPHYHKPSDTPDTLDYDSLTEVALGVAAGFLRVAKPHRI